MANNAKCYPRQVRAKITRTVTEIVIATLARDGSVEEVNEILEEMEMHDVNIDSIHSVLSVHG